MAILDDIYTYVNAQSTVLSTSNMGKAVMLDAGSVPNTFLSFYETAGEPGAHSFSTAAGLAERVFDRPGLQVLSRSTSYPTARTRAQIVYDLLDGVANKKMPTSTGILYLSISAVQAPFSLGRDENDRWLVSCNYRVERDR